MIYPKIKAIYKNNYALLYVADMIQLNKVQYLWLFIATLDGTIYDTIILPISKYKITSDTLTIYHTEEDETFIAVTIK